MIDLLFDESGAKLKKVAAILFVLGVIESLVFAIILGREDLTILEYLAGAKLKNYDFQFFKFLIILVVGLVASYISSLVLYGFGTLVENSDKQNTTSAASPSILAKSDLGTSNNASASNTWKCKKCGRMNYNYSAGCVCGMTKEESKGSAL